jgi:hypothetical protein
MGDHHQQHMPFNGNQAMHLVIAPPQKLFSGAVEILDFPPDQVIAEDGVRRQRQVGADQIVPFLMVIATIGDQFDPMITRQLSNCRPYLSSTLYKSSLKTERQIKLLA